MDYDVDTYLKNYNNVIQNRIAYYTEKYSQGSRCWGVLFIDQRIKNDNPKIKNDK